MRPRDPLAAREPGDDAISVALDTGNLDSGTDRDSFAGQMFAEAGDEFGIVARQHRPDIEHGDARAQPAMRLRHFDADRTAANDDQMVRPLAVGEDRLVRQIGYSIEPRYLGDRRLRAG